MALLGMALVTAPVQGAFVQTGTILGGAVFSGWSQTGVYTVPDGADGSGISAEQNIVNFHTAIATTDGGTGPPSAGNPITHFHFRVDTTSTATNKWGKFNVQMNLGSGAAGQVDHILQVVGVGPTATPPVIVNLYSYDVTQQVGAFTSGGITLRASNVPGDALFKSGVTTRLATWSASQYGWEIAVPVAWFGTTTSATANIHADGTGVQNLFGAVFSSTGNIGAVGTVKDVLNDASGNTYVLNTNLITGTSTFQNVGATQLVFTAQPQNADVGASLGTITVEIRDALGAKVATATHEVTIAIGTNPSGGTLSGTRTVMAVAGVATFSGLSIDTAGTGYTLTANAPGLTSATSNGFNIAAPPAAATRLAIQTQPSATATAGVAFAEQPVMLLQDSGGNTVTTDSSTQVTATIFSGSGTLLGTTTVTASNGAATFTNLKTNTASTITIQFTASGLTSATSASIVVSAAAADPTTTTASVPSGNVGSATTITITVRDAFGNTVTGARASLGVIVVGTNIAAPAVSEIGNGVYTASYTPTLAGIDTVTITLGALGINGSPYSSTVTAGTATKLGLQAQPSSTATAGVEFAQQPVILIQDASGNTITGDFTTQVTAAIFSGTGTLLGTTTRTAINGVVTFTNLKTNTADTITIRFTASGLTAVTSNNVVVSPAAADATTTTASVPAGTVGSATTITMTVRDAFGNTVTGATGNLAVSVSGANTATPSVSQVGNGGYTATYTPTTAGTDSIAVTLSTVAISSSPLSSIVSAGTATKLGIQAQPSSMATAGVVFGQQTVVLIQDASGNTVTGDSATQVTATIKTGNGTLLGTTTVTASSGIATFTNVKTNTADTITIEFTATGLTAVTSNSIAVSAATANPAQTTATAPTGTAGSATTITITVRDAFGNLVTGAAGRLVIAVTGANTASPSVSEVGSGVYTATYTPTAAGTDSIAITLSTVAISDSPLSSVVSAGVATQLTIQTQPSSTATAGVSFAQQPVIAIKDAHGNTVSTDSTTEVTATIKTGNGTLLGTTTVTTSNGFATFTNLKTNTADTITIEFTATGLSAVTSNDINVGTAPAHAAQTTAHVPNGTVGLATTITITVCDAFGNLVTGAAGLLVIAVTGANTASPSIAETGGGAYTATYTPSSAGSDSVAIRLNAVAINGSPYNSAVSAGTATKLGMQSQPSSTATAGVVFGQQPVVLIQDASGNTVTGGSTTQVTATIKTGNGTLIGTTTVTASNGIATFTNLKTSTADTITIEFTATDLTAVTSNNVTVSAAAANAGQTTASVPNGTVGSATTITITVRDAFGNLVPGAAGLSVGVLGANVATPSVIEVGGGVYTAAYTPNTTGADTVAIAIGITPVSGSPFTSTVTASTPSKLGIQTQPSTTATAGTPFAQQPAVLIQDVNGNTVTADSATQVTATIKTGSGTLIGTTTVTASNGIATFTNLKTNIADTITIEFTATGLTVATSNGIVVAPAPADASTTAATVPAGTSGSATTITIIVKDAFGNLVIGAAGLLVIAVTGANSASPTITDNGDGTYTATYTPTTTGTDTVTVTVGGTGISGSPYSSIVSAGAATKLGVHTQPSTTATAGTVFAQQPVVRIKDANGNTVTNDSTTTVTATIKTGNGTLLGTTTVTAANGIATFTNLRTNTADTITIEFTATGLTAVTSNSITIGSAAASASHTTATVPAGTQGTATTITITVRDAFGNLVTGAAAGLAGTVSGSNTATLTIVEVGHGIYTATYTPANGGSDSITLSAGGTGISGSPFTSTVVTTTLSITNPTPAAQETFLRGGGHRTVVVTGTGFQNGATATISGRNVAVHATTFVSRTELRLNITVEPIATPGNRTITITNPDGATAASRGIYLEALPQPVIQPAPVTPLAGQDVTFIDVSSSDDWRATIALRVWDFGDGSTSTATAPVHQYATPGAYTVKLTVTDSRGHSATTTRAVTVEAVPTELQTRIVAKDDTRVVIGTSVTFQQVTTGGNAPYNFTWTGRGLTSYDASATRTFTTLGSFPIKLNVEDDDGTRATHQITVHVYRPEILVEPETVPAGAQKVVPMPEGSVTLTANASKSPTAHIKVDIGNSPEAVERSPTIKVGIPGAEPVRYMAVTVFDEHDLVDFDRVRLEFTYTAADIAGLDESTLAVWYWNGSAWLNTRDHVGRVMPGDTSAQDRTVFDAGLDTVTRKVWAVVNEPSEYSLIGRTASVGGGGGGGRPAPQQPSASAAPGSEATGFDRTLSITLTTVDGGAQLTWTPSEPFAEDIIGYQVWRSMSPWTLVANVDAPTTTFVDTDAADGARYKVTYFTGFSFEQGYVTYADTLDQLPGWKPGDFARYDAPSPSHEQPARPVVPAPALVASPTVVPELWLVLVIVALLGFIAASVRVERVTRESLFVRRVWAHEPVAAAMEHWEEAAAPRLLGAFLEAIRSDIEAIKERPTTISPHAPLSIRRRSREAHARRSATYARRLAMTRLWCAARDREARLRGIRAAAALAREIRRHLGARPRVG